MLLKYKLLTSFLAFSSGLCFQSPLKDLSSSLLDGDKAPAITDSLPLTHSLDIFSTDTTQLLALHKLLVSIPSVSNHEHDIAIFLKGYLEAQNLEVELQPVASQQTSSSSSAPFSKALKPRFNVFAHPKGVRETPLLITSHIDTVPPFLPYNVRAGDEIW
ncbi:uncharacterized protein KY384_009145 [Bacidia gigantensis]|uniref:uncharacterized protein n=1 Tax=Bacidia gigantensis TaxID=2732470 RepID=UPI001D04B908|nr:uncharacterized protein KY384_009145 [Bacidia gigantensis]KAG8525501.1 hypothetical protein KY384_009145 [Bacidia gigantensis]